MENMRDACSEFVLQGQQNIRVSGRTMDWNTDLHSDFIVVPKGHNVISYLDEGDNTPIKQGKSWTTDYGYVGINVYNLPLFFDGLNEMGLSASLLFLKDTKYPVPQKDRDKNISMIYLLQYILGKCKDVEDVKNKLEHITVCGLHVLELKGNHGVHLIVHDSDGHNLAIEAEDGDIKKYYDDDATVLSNSPFLHWHLANMSNYCNITNKNISHDGSWIPFGNGSGMLGLPGDSTPPSRFVRMSILRKFSPISKTINEGVQQAFHILNRVSLVNGEVDNSNNGSTENDYTQWEVVRDHINTMYYFRTNQNQSIRAIDLNQIDFSGEKKYRPLPLSTGMPYQNLTPLFTKN